MEFKTIKKSHKKEIVFGVITVCILGGVLTYTTSKAKYKITESIPLASGTVNYKAPDFKVMAMYKSDDTINYTEIDSMPASDYTINESKSYCNMSTGNKNNDAILKTINGEHTIGKLKKNDRCFLYFDKISTTNSTIAKLN